MLVARFSVWQFGWNYANNYAYSMVKAIDDERVKLGIPSIFD